MNNFLFFLSLLLGNCILAQNSKQINLGAKVNTNAGELHPIITADGKKLFFVRDNYMGNTGGVEDSQDGYLSILGIEDKWQEASNLGKPFNSGKFNSIESVSVDQNSFIIRGSYDSSGVRTNKGGFSYIVKTENGFSLPTPITIKNYNRLSSGSKYSNISLCSDGKTMLIALSDPLDKMKGNIYVSFKNSTSVNKSEVFEERTATGIEEDTPDAGANGGGAPEEKKHKFSLADLKKKNRKNNKEEVSKGKSSDTNTPHKTEQNNSTSGVGSTGQSGSLGMGGRGGILIPKFEWSEPKPIKVFALKGIDEGTPYLASDMKTLYYSSDRIGSIGGNDIWMSVRQDDSWQNWSEPVNLGSEINTPSWDAYYTLDAKAEFAYMVSNQDGFGKGDIVKVQLKEVLRPKPVVLIKGKVYNDLTKKVMGASIIYENLVTNENIGMANANPQTGEYQIALPCGFNYGFLAAAPGFFSLSNSLDLIKQNEYTEIIRDLYLSPIEIGKAISLNNIFFDFGKASLRPESAGEIERLADLLIRNPSIEIALSGHTDNIGNEKANLSLSTERVNAVKKALVDKGLNESRINAQGFGSTKPVATNTTDDGRQRNRRVEFTVVKQ
ncbi:MAG: OmpA family protein [Sphingobacteriia bacterium]|nr:MAG: OmpA family protein [Sphingobacteriia bacterium]